MNKEDLINKYLNGETSLEEEKDLFNTSDTDQALEVWSHYVSKNRHDPPPTLETSLWKKILQKKKQQRLLYGLSGMAASILAFLIFWVTPKPSDQMSLSEKRQLLENAQALFNEESQPQEEIIYSDELIVIYSASR